MAQESQTEQIGQTEQRHGGQIQSLQAQVFGQSDCEQARRLLSDCHTDIIVL
jgi:hypothetical protein